VNPLPPMPTPADYEACVLANADKENPHAWCAWVQASRWIGLAMKLSDGPPPEPANDLHRG